MFERSSSDVSPEVDWREEFGRQYEPEEPRYSPAQAIPSGWLALEVDAATGNHGRGLGDEYLVEEIVALDRLSSWAAARQARLLAEFARRRPDDDPQAMRSDRPSTFSRYAPDEVGTALRLSRGAAMTRLGQSAHLAATLPATLDMWEDGRIDGAKVRAICDVTVGLEPQQARAVQERVLGRAPEQTVAQLRAALARAVIAVDPAGAAQRHHTARRHRRVVLCDESDGMAALWALLPAPAAQSCHQWLTRLARGLGGDDPREMDARRADLLVELLTGQLHITPSPAADAHVVQGGSDDGSIGSTSLVPVTPGKPLIQILMPYSTLTGADDQPCELVGYGPVPAGVAREIAADAVWKRLVTDPLSGALLDHGRTTYRPPAALADFVRARDVTCRFPTCRRRAIDAELDHARAFATQDGQTCEANLYGACLHHHRLKHHGGWTVTQHADGRIAWTAPTGHVYLSEPYDYRPDPGAAPTPPVPLRLAPAPEDDDEPPF